MNLKIVFKNLEHTEALDSKIRDKVETLSRFFEEKIDITWTCSVSDHHQRSDVHLIGPKIDIHADAQAQSLYETFDMAIHKVEKQLQKIKEKRSDKMHRKHAESIKHFEQE